MDKALGFAAGEKLTAPAAVHKTLRVDTAQDGLYLSPASNLDGGGEMARMMGNYGKNAKDPEAFGVPFNKG